MAIASATASAAIIPVYTVSRLAGSSDGSSGIGDGTGATARFFNPAGIVLDGRGNIYVADGANAMIRKISPDGTTITFAGAARQYGGTDGIGAAARFGTFLNALAIDATGNLYVTEWDSATIRKISPSGVVSTLAGTYGQRGNVDGLGAAARFRFPAGIAVDTSGNIYVSDIGNNNIRKITSNGNVTTFAGSVQGSADGVGAAAGFNSPYSLALDSGGMLYVADSGNSTIRKITSTGYVTTLAGLAGSAGQTDAIGFAARFSFPAGITVDSAGNIYVADTNNATLRLITPDLMVTTIAGSPGVRGLSDGQGSVAKFYLPTGLAVESGGNLYIADGGNNSIRKAVPTFLSLPAITAQPSSQTVVNGGSVTFSVNATNATSYRWIKEDLNNSTIVQENTLSTLTFSPAYSSSSGSYYVIVIGPGGTVQSARFTLTVVDAFSQPSKLTNISTRSYVGSDSEVLIAGFIIGGNAPKTVLVRAAGPALTHFGITNVIADPVLKVHQGDTIVASNDNWGDDPIQKNANLQAFQTAGAFAWPDGSKDSALITTLQPGLYTAIVSGNNRGSGAALVEVYELDPNNLGSKLINISTPSLVKTGENVQIAGFIISGIDARKVIIRASGPALTKYGVPDALADPMIELRRENTLMSSNDDWSASLLPDFQRVGIDNWASGSKDAALVATLPPGAYTAVVSGKNNSTGVALIEVFEEN